MSKLLALASRVTVAVVAITSAVALIKSKSSPVKLINLSPAAMPALISIKPAVMVTSAVDVTRPSVFISVVAVQFVPAEKKALSTFTVPALLIVTAPSAVLSPTFPSKSMLPVPAVSASVCAPSSVLAKVIVPAPAPVVIVRPASVRATAELKVTAPLVLVMSPPRSVAPVMDTTFVAPEAMMSASMSTALALMVTTPVCAVSTSSSLKVPVPAVA